MTNTNKDRDQVIRDHILSEDKLNHANGHLGDIEPSTSKYKRIEKPWAETNKYRVAMIMAPAWGVLFPPYNIAKLTGLLRHNDYSTKVYDLNIESYYILESIVGEDYWRGEKYFLWMVKENFLEKILPHIKPMFDKVIDELVEANPKVIGFSTYNTNIHAVEYLVNELKQRLPDTCFMAGGPEVSTGPGMSHLPFNYLFVGEAEETFLSVLENLPEEYPVGLKVGSTDSKLKLENLPFPDYSDYDLSSYQQPDGVSIETSRGCVAQCSFCAETYFWKFRSNTAERVVDEIEYQVNTFGVRRFWFVDSLVNGNLKVFEKIIDLIIERNIKIKWNSYARCDGRMDKKFIQKIKDSGCTCISYGVESGSQKVLNDMRKKVEVWEIENNLRHGREVDLFNHVNWIIGFPTEEPIDFLHSMQLLANSRKHIGCISPGFGAGPATASHMATDWKVYDMVGDNWLCERTFLHAWYTTNYKNTILHRFIRIKLFHFWLDILEKKAESCIENSQKYFNIHDFYKFVGGDSSVSRVEYDNFVDFNRFNDNMGVANEYLTLVYALYLYFGEFELDINFDPTEGIKTFGDWLTNDYTVNFSFKIDKEGNYDLSLTHSLNHRALVESKKQIYDNERNFEDKSFSETIKETGNIHTWKSDTIQVKETVHEQYRDKKKVIPIVTN